MGLLSRYMYVPYSTLYMYTKTAHSHPNLFPPLIMQIFQKLQIHIHKTAPQIHLQPPRIRLHRISRPRRQHQEIVLVAAHDEINIPHRNHFIAELFLKRLDAQACLLMHAPVRVGHVLGDELPLPRAALGIAERHASALLEADDQWVEVRGGP